MNGEIRLVKSKSSVLPTLIALTGLLYIFAVPSEPEAIKLLFKLIPMALIIAYAYRLSADSRKRYHWLVLAGLFFCAIGDGTLRWFVLGLSAFLVGHLFYLTAFFGRWRFSKLRLATALPIAAFAAVMGSQLVQALTDSGKTDLIVPVLVYVAVISTMGWSAIMTGNRTAIAGSLLFMASDSILSWNMFVSDVPYSGPLIMLTYYSAQFLIATSLREKPAASAGASLSSSARV
ncbi:lysoplasmalogenase [Cohnella sp. CIP 111063]|jgi:alkenylglycerophosphocholine/alkenylglycerophosphoethanolamine hydrolase|nr:lysoplasmalogenase [Cohnella sp. CIP 111063]